MNNIENNEASNENLNNHIPMSSIALLFEANKCKKEKAKKYIKFIDKRYVYVNNTNFFDGEEISNLLKGLCAVPKIKGITVEINLRNSNFADKITYIILECICYYLIRFLGYKVEFYWNERFSIGTEGLRYSPIQYLANTSLFSYTFLNDDDNPGHYRGILLSTASDSEVSAKASEISDYFQENGIEIETALYLSKTLSEVIGNAIEHGASDCLIDIDITDPKYHKSNNEDNYDYYGINVAVVSFSEIPFYQKLKNKMNDEEFKKTKKFLRYKYISDALSHHSKHFGIEFDGYLDVSTKYNENDFYTFASFQDRISGSFDKERSGGTGLTRLIQAIEEKSESSYCYQLCRRRLIILQKDILQDKDNIIGFNQSGDFVNDIPDHKVFGCCSTDIPGTVYSLNFVIRN